jgi:DNA processing protein
MMANTQAILLLTAPLIAGRGEDSCDRLSPGEYNRLARMLREKQKQPADLTGPEAQAVLDLCCTFDRARLESLLARGFLLSQAVDRWNARSIWVVSRADAEYPRRLKARLKEDAPPVLYGCGDAALLDTGGLAVVGSRHVDDELIRYTEGIGRLSAEARRTIVSGAAKGIDRAAMSGALEAGGGAVGVMADSLERAALLRDNRDPLMDGRLVLVSPYDPAAGFNVGHAMQRNKLIYALADAAFVVNSDFETGGTWAGAVEQLDRLRFVPVFVRNGENAGKGNAALLRRGGKLWPDPRDGAELSEVLSATALSAPAEPEQVSIFFVLPDETREREVEKPAAPGPAIAAEHETSPADELLNAVREILGSRLVLPRSEAEVIELLAITKPQAKVWLSRLVEEGVLEKLKKPVRYRAANASARLL